MSRRHLAFLVLVNAFVSLVVALGVVWAFEARRPDPEELAAINTPRPGPVLAMPPPTPEPATPTPAGAEPIAPPTGEPAATPASETPAAEEIYIVQPGDTLLVIATRYNLTVDDILRANNLTNPDYVFSGQRLVIPVQGAGATPTGAGQAGEESGGEAVVEGVAIAAISGAGDLANEQVLVVNESNAALSLQGWRLEREGGPAYTFGNVPLFPGGSVRVHSGAGVDSTLDFYWNQTQPVWGSGAVARLLNPEGGVVSIYPVP
ncbi:MAG TPA: LysM peptidoglycan-binding domain-containing protein [Caldilineaceae bacterium]|nr:LysM peptidoglycan-binding domain-containing protein [Caldilineaceae bacterium]